MTNKDSKIPLQLLRERQNRHKKLMSMINSYQLTKQQKAKLQKIKSHTMMEINLRFLRSQVNRNYKFPKINKVKVDKIDNDEINLLESEDSQEEDKMLRQQLEQKKQQGSKRRRRQAEAFVYNLRNQNNEKNKKQVKQMISNSLVSSEKFLQLQQSRRVHSLGNEKSQQKDDFIIRRHMPLKHSNQRFAKSPLFNQSKSTQSLKKIKLISQTKKPSKQYLMLEQTLDRSPKSISQKNYQKNIVVDNRKIIKLPQININSNTNNSKSLKKLAPIQQKLKTQKQYDQEDIQMAIGKKLVTQASDSGKKVMRGVEKYLKELESEKQQGGNQHVRMMRRQKQSSKTAKNSLKGEIDQQT